jgi:diacylglycerol O-acyltransferase / wax synthase
VRDELHRTPHSTQLERLSREDTRILGLESGNVRGHTVKVIVVEGRHDADAVRRHVAARLGAEPRLRHRLAPTPLRLAPPAWVDDPAFDLTWHVRARPSDGDLRHVVAELMVEALDRRRPLWRMDVASPVEDDCTAIVWRIHHCLADGGTVIRMATRLFLDSEPDPQPPAAAEWRPGATLRPQALLSAGARERVHRLAEARRSAGWRDPWIERSRGLAHLPRAVWRELSPSGASSPLDAMAGPRRKVEFVSADLEDLKRIEHSAPERVTVNDIVLSAVASGLRRWLVDRGASLHGLRLKVPVSLHRGPDDGIANRDRFIFVALPLELGDPHERLLAVARQTRVRKADRDAQMLDMLLGDLARLSAPLERRVERWLMSPRVFTLTVSNVRGPDCPVWVMGARLRGLHSLAEIADRHALRVAVVSAAGRVSFGLCADADAVDRLELVSQGIAAEIEALHQRALRGAAE